MGRKVKFTFRQALINVIIACSVLIGLSLLKGFSFYEKRENIGVILLVFIFAMVVLVAKWRGEKNQNQESRRDIRNDNQ